MVLITEYIASWLLLLKLLFLHYKMFSLKYFSVSNHIEIIIRLNSLAIICIFHIVPFI